MTTDDRAFAAAWKIVSAWDGKITKPVLRKAIEAYLKASVDIDRLKEPTPCETKLEGK